MQCPAPCLQPLVVHRPGLLQATHGHVHPELAEAICHQKGLPVEQNRWGARLACTQE